MKMCFMLKSLAPLSSLPIHNYDNTQPQQQKHTQNCCYSYSSSYLTPNWNNSVPMAKAKKSQQQQQCVISSHHNHKQVTPSTLWKDDRVRRQVVIGGASIGMAMVVMLTTMGNNQEALAFGLPEGPLVEEFWENVRRYGLYALTVSTGALYALVQPILELLKNPISAILIIVILGGTFFIVSQILSAMVGVSDFSYQYTY